MEPISLYEPVYSDSGDSIYVMDQLSDDKNTDEAWLEDIALREAMKRLRHLLETEDAVTLTLPYTVTHYTKDDAQLYHGGREAQLTFQVKID